ELHDALMLLGVMTQEEAAVSIPHEGNGVAAERFLNELVASRRATQLRFAEKTFWVAAERLPMLQAIYEKAVLAPQLPAPESAQGQPWERAAAIRELLRGRMEVCGAVTPNALAEKLGLARSEIDAALLGLEAEGFVLRGKFHPQVTEQEWCDRRLLARIHRLTIDRLRAEIQPVSPQDFYRFLFAWQRADLEHRVEGLEGLQSILEQLDGCELQLAAWESAVIAARVNDYDPEWLDRLGFVTSDSFDGLRALLVPSDKRPTFGRNTGKRRRKTNLASIEFAGRWSLLRSEMTTHTSGNGADKSSRDRAIEKFARVLLRRYGVVFRRLLERENFDVTWYELGRIYRRWEARGEIRGGY